MISRNTRCSSPQLKYSSRHNISIRTNRSFWQDKRQKGTKYYNQKNAPGSQSRTIVSQSIDNYLPLTRKEKIFSKDILVNEPERDFVLWTNTQLWSSSKSYPFAARHGRCQTRYVLKGRLRNKGLLREREFYNIIIPYTIIIKALFCQKNYLIIN